MTDLNQAYGTLIDMESPNSPQPSIVVSNENSQPLRQNVSSEMKKPASIMSPPVMPQQIQSIPQQYQPQQPQPQPQPQRIVDMEYEKPSYFDKLFSKKRELWKALQIALIIILALSLHVLIDYYMKMYFSNNALSFERDLLIRLLYPIGIIFLLWNSKAFIR